MRDILDAQEVADMLRVHPRTIMRLAKLGHIPGFKVGGQWRFRREAIEAYIREQEQRYSDQKKDKVPPSDPSDSPPATSTDEREVDKR